MNDFGPAPHRFRDPSDPGLLAERVGRLLGKWRPDAALIEHYRRAHFRGDPAADAVVEWMHEVGMRKGMALFERALENGIAAVADPPAPLLRLFEEVEATPIWLDRRSIAKACALAERVALGHNYVLFSISLLAGYVSAGVTKTLVATGELEAMAPRRLGETSKFLEDVYGSKTLERSSDGFKNTIRVRMMHAFVRRKLLRSGWETHRWGIPINQADMAGTVLSFSITYLIGLRMLGFIIPKEERRALFHLWRYVGRLLGVDETILPATERDSVRLLYLAAASQEGPDEDGRSLARALLAVPIAYRDKGLLGAVLSRFDVDFGAGFTRSFVGDVTADRLGIPDTPWKHAVLLLAAANTGAEIARLAVPGFGRIGTRLGRTINDFRRRALLGERPAKFEPRTGVAHA